MQAFNVDKPALQWARDSRCAVEYDTLLRRVKDLGWHPEKAITTPPVPANPSQKFPPPTVCVDLPGGLVFVGDGICGCGSVEALYSGGAHFMRCMGCMLGE